MRALLLAVIFACLAWPASAAPRAPDADFNGFYLGLQSDYGFGGGGDWCFCTATPLVADATGGDGGILAGLNAGYDVHLGPIVLGAETRLSYAEISFAEQCGVGIRCFAELRWLGEALVSAGVAIGHTHIALGAGLAAGDVRAETNAPGALGLTENSMHDGRVFTARIEQGMSGGWRYALEYRYYDMSGSHDIPGAQVDIDWTTHIGGLRITYELPD